jgi:phage-related holin
MSLVVYLSKALSIPAEVWTLIKVSLYSLFAFLNVDVDVAHIIMWLMLVDTVTGIIKSIVVGKLMFAFKALYTGILTKFVLLLIPMLVSLTAMGLGYEFKWVIESALRLIVLSESISVLTNIISIKQRRNIQNKDYLSLILNTIRGWMIFMFDAISKDKFNHNENKDRDDK